MEQVFPKRHSIRLLGFDYSQDGWYFITICTDKRRNLFGKIFHENMYLSPLGHIANWEWIKLRLKFDNITLDKYIVMPNHLHGIINIRAGVNPAPTLIHHEPTSIHHNCSLIHHDPPSTYSDTTLGQIIGRYKSSVVHESILFSNNTNKHLGTLWQRNYYEHIIRDQKDLNRIREYMDNNVINWQRDKLHSP